MRKNLLIAVALLASVGCYREPSDPSQVRQNVDSQSRRPETMVPRGSVPVGHSGAPGAIIQSRKVEIGELCLTAPSDWLRREPSSQMLLAEFSLLKAEGDRDDGRLTVSTAGGTVEDNVNRWKGQFGGTPTKESQETLEANGVTITLVDYTGTFTDQRGPFAAGAPKSGYRMLGAIIPIGEQLFFVKGSGLEKTMVAHAEKFRGLLQSLKPKSGADKESEAVDKPAADEKPAAGETPAAE